MKAISKVFTMCMLLLATSHIKAQVSTSSRPDLFKSYSENVPASVSELGKAFSATAGSSIKLSFDNKFTFTGTVLSSVCKYKNLSTVIIKSPLLNNALFSISRITNDDKTITYVGRIINEKYADAYELVKDNSGNYSFNKIKTENLIQDF